MTDPKRWTETDDESEDARQLVTTLSKAEPTASMRASVWAKVAATLPAGPGSGGPDNGSGGAAGGGTAGAGAISTGAKLMAAAALGAGALSIWILTRTEAPAPVSRTAAPVALATATPATPTPTPTELPVPQPLPIAIAKPTSSLPQRPTSPVAPEPTASAASPTIVPATVAADRLREETEGVKRARRLLRDKNPAAALTELDRLARLFPNGPLEEEREVLTIEALVGSTSSTTADLGRRRAQRFLAERPQSVHAARVRGLAGP
ncbi:MAG: hypothetical protein JWP87_5410 [Labilithrix sp.]|nr:hypothetical protein [Labilithrix sp.]